MTRLGRMSAQGDRTAETITGLVLYGAQGEELARFTKDDLDAAADGGVLSFPGGTMTLTPKVEP